MIQKYFSLLWKYFSANVNLCQFSIDDFWAEY